MDDHDQAVDFANELRQSGCRFALDDFGTGFASFYYLKHIPLEALKIDGDFIRNLRENSTDQLMVKHMAEIASSLGLITIAEFVEDGEILEMLDDYGIDAAQGYHVGRPEPAFAGGGPPPSDREHSVKGPGPGVGSGP